MRITACLLALLCFGATAGSAEAQDYPAKRVAFIVPWAAGGGTDVLARAIAQKMSESMGQPVVVDNKAGANGTVGTEFVARAPADGYTIVMATADSHAINPSLYPKLPYDAVKDFAPVSLISQQPFVLVAHPSVPAKSVQELIALAKAKPGTLNYGSWGIGSTAHLAMELFKQKTGTDIVHVPYRSAAPAVTDILAGHINLLFLGPLSAVPNMESGKLRGYVTTTAQRPRSFPDYPTMVESGFPDFDITSWYGIMAPAGTPRPVVDRLRAEIVKAMKEPEVVERMKALGHDPIGNDPEAFAAFQRADIARWAEVIRISGAKAEQ